MAEKTLPTVGPLERQALRGLAEFREGYGRGYYLPFRTIAERSGLPREKVRRAVRGLARKGLAEYARALCHDDGQFAGAGYCCTKLGWEVYSALENPEAKE